MDIMSINSHGVQSNRRATLGLLLAVAVETALTIGHFAHGAGVYQDPARLHVVLPALGFLLLAGALAGLYLWRPGRWTLWPLVVEVAVVFVFVFGAYHGAFSHALKDLLYFAGTGAERLAEIFDSPDFAVPDDLVFELTGIATAIAATWVGVRLVKLVRGTVQP